MSFIKIANIVEGQPDGGDCHSACNPPSFSGTSTTGIWTARRHMSDDFERASEAPRRFRPLGRISHRPAVSHHVFPVPFVRTLDPPPLARQAMRMFPLAGALARSSHRRLPCPRQSGRACRNSFPPPWRWRLALWSPAPCMKTGLPIWPTVLAAAVARAAARDHARQPDRRLWRAGPLPPPAGPRLAVRRPARTAALAHDHPDRRRGRLLARPDGRSLWATRPARNDGLSAAAGRPSRNTALFALTFGGLVAGIGAGVVVSAEARCGRTDRRWRYAGPGQQSGHAQDRRPDRRCLRSSPGPVGTGDARPSMPRPSVYHAATAAARFITP